MISMQFGQGLRRLGGMPIDEGGPRMCRPGGGPKQNWQIKNHRFIFIANLRTIISLLNKW